MPKAHIRMTTTELPLYLRISGVQKDVCDKIKINRDAYGMTSTQQREVWAVWVGVVRPGLHVG
jgi:hypothetical protein